MRLFVGGYGTAGLVRDRPRGSYRWNVKRPPLPQVEFIRIKTLTGPRADYSLEIRKLVANRNKPDQGPIGPIAVPGPPGHTGLCFMRTLYAPDCERHRNALNPIPIGPLILIAKTTSGLI